MTAVDSPVGERWAGRLLAAADRVCNHLYGHRGNPLYQSGTIVVVLYVVVFVTGLWLLLFYRVGSPWDSVSRLAGDPWVGRWARGIHRYASDLALVATAVHAFRMYAQGRSAGPRVLAWISGGVLLVLLLICGWTGYVLVWDTFGEHLAREGARLLDALPVLSEPTSRAFTGEQPVPPAFFFLNLFAHVGIPLGMCAVFLLHVKRLARPALWPPRIVGWAVIAGVTAAAVVRPPHLGPPADPFRVAAEVPADLLFAFWIPLTRDLSGGAALLSSIALGGALLVLPPLLRRRRAAARPPSAVDPDLCVGCDQCALDCPYGAISMVARTDGRSERLAQVDSALCVSCGICAGSCSPMGIGPPGRTGRDQLAGARAFLADPGRRAGEIVAICCAHGAAAGADRLSAGGAVPYLVDCAGSLHTSVIELMLRGGAGGVVVLSCPPRDCWNREGTRWAQQRIYDGREAELQARVDRTRVALVHVDALDGDRALAAVRALTQAVASLRTPAAAPGETEASCGPVMVEGAP